MIRHIVTWKLASQEPAEKATAFDTLVEGFGALPAIIPEIKTLHLGRDLDETAGNWDVTLIIDASQVHPAHEKVKTVVRGLTGERASIDFEL
jgi:hypothetical protein